MKDTENLTASDLRKLTKKDLVQRVLEVDQATQGNALANAKSDEEKTALTEEHHATTWSIHNAHMLDLGNALDIDPSHLAILDPRGLPCGRIANFARKMAVDLFRTAKAILAKELEGTAKKIAGHRMMFQRGFLMLHGSNQAVMKAITEAHRQAGGEATGVKILANGSIDLRRELIAKT